MIIELQTAFGNVVRINSNNPATIGAWLAEWARTLECSNNALQPVGHMYVFPDVGDEGIHQRDWPMLAPITAELLTEVKEVFDRITVSRETKHGSAENAC